jgi:hypothetical protein
MDDVPVQIDEVHLPAARNWRKQRVPGTRSAPVEGPEPYATAANGVLIDAF